MRVYEKGEFINFPTVDMIHYLDRFGHGHKLCSVSVYGPGCPKINKIVYHKIFLWLYRACSYATLHYVAFMFQAPISLLMDMNVYDS